MGVPTISFVKVQGLVAMGPFQQCKPGMSIIHGDWCWRESPETRLNQEGHLPRIASNSITGERVLIGVEEGGELVPRCRAYMDVSQQVLKPGNREQAAHIMDWGKVLGPRQQEEGVRRTVVCRAGCGMALRAATQPLFVTVWLSDRPSKGLELNS